MNVDIMAAVMSIAPIDNSCSLSGVQTKLMVFSVRQILCTQLTISYKQQTQEVAIAGTNLTLRLIITVTTSAMFASYKRMSPLIWCCSLSVHFC